MPSSILIDFDGERKVFEEPDTPLPWDRNMEVYVGEAPTVEVSYKTGTSQFLVKTFKFKTTRGRRINITVSADVYKKITASLATLEPVDENAVKSEIVVLGSNGEISRYSRDNMRRIVNIPLFDGVATEAQFRASAELAFLTLPPPRAEAVFIYDLSEGDYNVRRTMLQALESVGYTDVQVISKTSMLLSNALHLPQAKHEVGEVIGVAVNEPFAVYVLKKTETGYHCLTLFFGPILSQHFPQVKKIIYFVRPNNPAKKAEAIKMYAPLPVQFVHFEENLYMIHYMYSKLGDTFLDGYQVSMPVDCIFKIKYGNKETKIDEKQEPVPWQKTVNIDVGNAPKVDIYVEFFADKAKEHLFKQFNFKTAKKRKVAVTITMEDIRIPKIELVTL
uniref:DUF4139 domain-containing protein n=1 Tax=Panagrellus redivivus TaxID=6233 RepID=A0A7E4V7I3_PANRE